MRSIDLLALDSSKVINFMIGRVKKNFFTAILNHFFLNQILHLQLNENPAKTSYLIFIWGISVIY